MRFKYFFYIAEHLTYNFQEMGLENPAYKNQITDLLNKLEADPNKKYSHEEILDKIKNIVPQKIEVDPEIKTHDHPILMSRSKMIDYTAGQKNALIHIQNMIDNRSHNSKYYLLAGYAGTGKTTIAENIARYALSKGKRMYIMAPTNKAANLLAEKLQQAEVNIKPENIGTIHKMIYGSPTSTGTWNLSNVISDSVILIDESSMIDSRVMNDIMRATENGNVVIFMGDSYQLQPVGSDPKLFQGGVKEIEKSHELTDVRRQTLDSNVLKVATMVRTDKTPYVPDKSTHDFKVSKSKDEFLDDFKESIKNNEDCIMIVATNRERTAMNMLARETKFGSDSEILNDGDVLISVANAYGDNWRMPNSEMFTINSHEKKFEVSVDDQEIYFYKVSDEEGKTFTLALLPYLSKPTFYHTEMMEHANRNKDLYNYLDSENLLVDKKVSKYAKLDQSLVIATYGYAITAHKAQGSQWEKVFVNQDYAHPSSDASRWYYTAITRSSKNVIVLNSGYNVPTNINNF